MAEGRRRNRRERWVLDVVAREAASVPEAASDTVYTCGLGGRLAELLDREEVEITFNRRAARDGVELASPGSWMHDQLLRYAREWGRTTRFFVAPAPEGDRSGCVARRRNAGTPARRVDTGWTVLQEFVFRLSYYSDPPREDLVRVAWDQTGGRILSRGTPRRLLATAGERPVEDWAPLPRADVAAGFRAAWEYLEGTVEAEVHRLRREGQERLDAEVGKLENYYRQLIEEENRVLKGRISTKAREEAQARLDLLKLEWERRVKEETRRLQPQVVATLVAGALVYLPAERWELDGGEHGTLWIDPHRGTSWTDPDGRCQSTGNGR